MPHSFPMKLAKLSYDSESTVSTASFLKSRFQINKRKDVEPSKKVSFHPQVKIYMVERCPESTVSQLWYSRKEEHAIAVANQKTIKKFRENSFTESSLETFLGLEGRLTRAEVKIKRHCICSAVLQAQLQFHMTGVSNIPERLSTVYKEHIDIFF